METNNSPEILELIDWFYNEYVYLNIFLEYHKEKNNNWWKTNDKAILFKIIRDICNKYQINTDPDTILLWFLDKKNLEKTCWKVVESSKQNIFELFNQNNLFSQIISTYEIKLNEFFYNIKYWLEKWNYKTFDKAFDWSKDLYIPNFEKLWLKSNEKLYNDLVVIFKVILRKKWYEAINSWNLHGKTPIKTWHNKIDLAGTGEDPDN